MCESYIEKYMRLYDDACTNLENGHPDDTDHLNREVVYFKSCIKSFVNSHPVLAKELVKEDKDKYLMIDKILTEIKNEA